MKGREGKGGGEREEERKLGKKKIGRMLGITKVLSQITKYIVHLISTTYNKKRIKKEEKVVLSFFDGYEILDEQKVLYSSHLDFFGSELMFLLNQTVKVLMVGKS